MDELDNEVCKMLDELEEGLEDEMKEFDRIEQLEEVAKGY